MSSEKTPNLALHKWGPDDFAQMQEFNENFVKLDEKIAETTEALSSSGAEVVEVKNQLSDVTEQLAESKEQILVRQPKIYGNRFADTLRNVRSIERKAIVSFVSDDLYIEDWNKRDWFKALGAPYTIPVVANYINAKNKPTAEQLKILQDEYGYEIGSHTVTHAHLPTLTDTELEYELVESKRIIESHGLTCNNFFVPYGEYNDGVLKKAAKYYRSTRISEEGQNHVPINSLKLNTRWIDQWGSGTLETYKGNVDYAITNKTWLIFSMHTGAMTEDEFENKVKPLIEYIHSVGVEIMTVDKALDIYGNLFELANFTGSIASRNLFTIDCDGNIHTKDDNYYMKTMGVLNTPVAHTPTDMSKGITRASIQSASAIGYPENAAGVLTVYKIGGRDFWVETYQIYQTNRIYTRWATSDTTWSPWIQSPTTPDYKVNVETSTYIGSQVTNDTLPNGFPVGKVSYVPIPNAYKTGFPNNVMGVLVTYRISSETSFCYQEFHPEYSSTVYKRSATSQATWGAWTKVSV